MGSVKLLTPIMKRSMRRKVTWKAKKGNPEKISVKDIESPTDIVNVPKAILMLFNDHVEESIIGNSRVKCCYNEKNDEIDVDVENDEIDVDMYE